MKQRQLEYTLVLIRSLIAVCVGMVVGMLSLSLNFWLQSQWFEADNDTLVSMISFLLPLLLGGIGAGASVAWSTNRIAILHGLLFSGVYLLMFIPGWLQAEAIGPGLIAGLILGGIMLALAGAWIGTRLRLLIRQLRR